MAESPKEKWYFNNPVLVVSIFCVGPLALPLLWFNPRFSYKMKLGVSIAVVVLTYLLVVMSAKSFKNLTDYYQVLLDTVKEK